MLTLLNDSVTCLEAVALVTICAFPSILKPEPNFLAAWRSSRSVTFAWSASWFTATALQVSLTVIFPCEV